MAETLLTVEHLIKKYGDQVILDDVSLDVKKGEVIVVVGPSGCGKSTLLRCINALEPIQGGVVKLGSEVIDPKSKSLTRLRQKIGMVFQSYDLFPHLTVLDNILLAPTKVQKRSKDEVKEEAMKLLRRVGLEEKAGSYPRELSGGQKQRVAIVRALCMHPEILLFDKVYAWSGSDRAQILHEIKAKNIVDEKIASFMEEFRWVDYQDIFMKRYEMSRKMSLEEALGRADIDPEGRFHDGLNDAVNTGLLIEKLELNPDYQLVSYEMSEKPSEHLSSSLGELFAGMELKLA